jgi:hypothetical protein
MPYGISCYGSRAHLVKAITRTSRDGTAIYGVRWACGEICPTATLLTEPGEHKPCPKCATYWPVVYHCFSDGHLLYIGSTVNLPPRLRDHKRHTPWWPEVTNVIHEKFPSVRTVRRAEARAIKAEHPLYNRQHAIRSAA